LSTQDPSSEEDGEEDPRLNEVEVRVMLDTLRLSPQPVYREEGQPSVAPDGLPLDWYARWLNAA
jgi:hypothetical protein